MIVDLNKHTEHYNNLLREITIMQMELNKHIDDKPQGVFYKSNWIMKRKALESSIKDFIQEADRWKYDNPECFV